MSHSTRNQVPITAQRKLTVAIPPIKEQERIADILGTLDDKIELNRRTSETLEAMARRLFKSWFVDFDPVHAKAAVRRQHPDWPNARVSRAALPNLDPKIAKLFPDAFNDSILGPIPKGWQVGTLDDGLGVLETGSRPRGGVGHITEGIPSVGAESIVGLGIFDFGKTKYVGRDFFAGMKKGHVQNRDVLLYKDGGKPGLYEPHVSMFGDGFPFETFCINEHVYRLRANDRLSQEFLYFWLNTDPVADEMRVKGTGVAVPGLNSTAVRSLTILFPDPGTVESFTNVIAPSMSLVFSNCLESKRLARVRDKLLPKLLSGEMPASVTTE